MSSLSDNDNYDDYYELILGDDSTINSKYIKRNNINNDDKLRPTDAQIKEMERFLSMLKGQKEKSIKEKDNDDNQDDDDIESENFDITTKVRIILHQGRVLKKAMHSLVSHNSKRYLCLLNDYLLICSVHEPSYILSSQEKYSINQALKLDNITITDLVSVNEILTDEVIRGFRLTIIDTDDNRDYIFYTENESDKRIWVEEITSAILSYWCRKPSLSPGWQHNVIRGTFHSAAYLSDMTVLKLHISQRLKAGDSVDEQDELGMTPLHWAALNGNKYSVESLLEAGASIDNLNNGLNSPLILASSVGHEQVVNTLINMGADVHIRNLKDKDALLMAVLFCRKSTGLYDTCQLLFENGINVSQTDSFGATALHECAVRNLGNPVQVLVDLGANVNALHLRNGLSPLQMACMAKRCEAETMRSFLDKGAFPNYKDQNGRSAIDLILATHREVGSSETDTEPMVDFLQYALPCIMEIVRKGGRYMIDSISHLRPSIREAIDTARLAWSGLVEPADFNDFVSAVGTVNKNKCDWTKDSTSKVCLCCVDKFTLSSRRHHCRACGVLCCSLCSSKRLLLTETVDSEPPSPKSPNNNGSPRNINPADCRVCDGCFNKLLSQYQQTSTWKSKSKKESQILNTSVSNSKELFDRAVSKSSNNNNITTTTNSIFMTKELLNERQQKLEEVTDKSEQLKEAASDFRMLTKDLLNHQKNRWI